MTPPRFHTGLTLRPGERAIAIPVVAVSAVGGAITPGARVDVLAVPLIGRAPAGRAVELLAADALVLDVRTESGAPYVAAIAGCRVRCRPHRQRDHCDRARGRDPVCRPHRDQHLRARIQLGALTYEDDASSRSGQPLGIRCSSRATWGTVRLTRTAGVTYLESDRGVEEAIRRLALAGIRSSLSSVPVPRSRPPTRDRARISNRSTLLFEAIDVVEVRRIPLGDASAALMHRRLPWLRRSRAARDACLRLLREEDAVIGWRRDRVVLGRRAARGPSTRARCARSSSTARRSIARTLRWTYVSAGPIERWAFP